MMALLQVVLWCVFLEVFNVLGHKLGLLSFKTAFIVFGLALLAGLIIGLFALAIWLLSFTGFTHPDQRQIALWVAPVGILPCVLVFMMVGTEGLKAPRIHDISTNLDQPLHFQHAQALRGASEHVLAPPSAQVVALQRRHYRDLAPIVSAQAPKEAFAAAQAVAERLGWKIHHRDANLLQFEAVDETRFFGFKDDVIVRVSRQGNQSRIDVRSASRVGKSDLGANAARITAFANAF